MAKTRKDVRYKIVTEPNDCCVNHGWRIVEIHKDYKEARSRLQEWLNCSFARSDKPAPRAPRSEHESDYHGDHYYSIEKVDYAALFAPLVELGDSYEIGETTAEECQLCGARHPSVKNNEIIWLDVNDKPKHTAVLCPDCQDYLNDR